MIFVYPCIIVTRSPDWGWGMYNQYVMLHSYDEVLEARKEAELKELEERRREKEMGMMTPTYLAALPIKELKDKLVRWKVDIRTCFEKSDLVEKAVAYVEHCRHTKEEQQLKNRN